MRRHSMPSIVKIELFLQRVGIQVCCMIRCMAILSVGNVGEFPSGPPSKGFSFGGDRQVLQ